MEWWIFKPELPLAKPIQQKTIVLNLYFRPNELISLIKHLASVDIAYKLCYLLTYLMLSYVNPGPSPSPHGPLAQLMCLAHGDASSQPPPPLPGLWPESPPAASRVSTIQTSKFPLAQQLLS